MQVCIAVMFVTVVVTAVLLWPGTGAVLEGLLVPGIPDGSGEGLACTVAPIGGVGGTLTVLCYGFSRVLGVWQAKPYLFADCWALLRRRRHASPVAVDTPSKPYRICLLHLARRRPSASTIRALARCSSCSTAARR